MMYIFWSQHYLLWLKKKWIANKDEISLIETLSNASKYLLFFFVKYTSINRSKVFLIKALNS
jgi:hypothetical protein